MNSMDDSFGIDTERLTLRVPALADFDESAAMLNNPDVTRYLGARSFSREECWMRHLRSVGHWQLFGFGFWIVRARRSGQFVGVVGFGEFRREVEPSLEGSPEAGWVLTAPAHGHGYATEAALGGHKWFAARHGAKRTVCMIEEGNDASLRVAAKCGYHEFARTMYKNAPVILLERLP